MAVHDVLKAMIRRDGKLLAACLWVVLMLAGLTVIACSTVTVTGPSSFDSVTRHDDRTITVSLAAGRPAFVTQATVGKVAANVHHFTIKLYNWNLGTSTLGGVVHTHFSTSGQPRVMQFSNVGPGVYKITAEAFQSSNDTLSITQGGPQQSTNHVTVAYGNTPQYSAGVSLAASMTLLDAAGDVVNLGANVANGETPGPGSHLAPGDTGAANTIHDFAVEKAGVTSTFVWIPKFNAFQLIVPSNCGNINRFGFADNARPAGYWVSSQPNAGTSVGGTPDWHEALFGGFYVGKFEASRADATSGAAGSATTLKVQSGVVPWGAVDWDEASRTCLAYDGAARVMGDREWTALAVGSMINGITVYGNNNSGGTLQDFDNAAVTFTDDPTDANGRSLTGSGPGTTSHTGAADGVFDLNGNVAEWTFEVSRTSLVNDWVVMDQVTGASAPLISSNVASLITQKPLFFLGLPNTGGASTHFNNDSITSAISLTAGKMLRGGAVGGLQGAGVWAVDTSRARNYMSWDVGFRPVLRY